MSALRADAASLAASLRLAGVPEADLQLQGDTYPFTVASAGGGRWPTRCAPILAAQGYRVRVMGRAGARHLVVAGHARRTPRTD